MRNAVLLQHLDSYRCRLVTVSPHHAQYVNPRGDHTAVIPLTSDVSGTFVTAICRELRIPLPADAPALRLRRSCRQCRKKRGAHA